MRRHLAATLLGSSLASLALGGSALGQTVSIPPEDVASHVFKDRESVRFVGKYMGLVADRIQLLGMKQIFVLVDPDLARKLLDLETNVDNVTVQGYLDSSRGTRDEQVFAVESIGPAPTDVELFQSRFRQLALDPGTSTERCLRLAEAVHRTQQRSPDVHLAALLSEVMRRCFVRSVSSIPRASLRAKLKLLDELFRRVPLDSLRGQLLVELLDAHPDAPEIEERLVELGYRHLSGEWISYPDFKLRLGFVWDGTGWRKALELEHEAVVEALRSVNLTNLVLRNRTNRQFQQLARSGTVVAGMTREEVVEAVGHPDRVRRLWIKKAAIDQWQYTDSRVYLVDGKVIIAWAPESVAETLKELSETVQRRARGEPDPPAKKAPEDPRAPR